MEKQKRRRCRSWTGNGQSGRAWGRSLPSWLAVLFATVGVLAGAPSAHAFGEYAGVEYLSFKTVNANLIHSQGGDTTGGSAGPLNYELYKLYRNDESIGVRVYGDGWTSYGDPRMDLYAVNVNTGTSMALALDAVPVNGYYSITNTLAQWRQGNLLLQSGTYGVKVVSRTVRGTAIWTQQFYYVHADRAPLCSVRLEVNPPATSEVMNYSVESGQYRFADGSRVKLVSSTATVLLERGCGLAVVAQLLADGRPFLRWSGVDEESLTDDAWSGTYIDGDKSITAFYEQPANVPPNTPTLSSPPHGATGQSLTPLLQASAFSDPDGDLHAHSQWLVDDGSAFASPEWDSGEGAPANTQADVPSGSLAAGMTYYWRVRYQDSLGAWSQWSEVRSFSTESAAVTTISTTSTTTTTSSTTTATLQPGGYDASGWLFFAWPYAYDWTSGDWWYFEQTDQQWVYGFPPATGGWTLLGEGGLASGWSYLAWPYAYDSDGGAWYYFNEMDTQWCVNLRTGQWATFGP